MPLSSPPYLPHAPSISSFFIRSPEMYVVNSGLKDVTFTLYRNIQFLMYREHKKDQEINSVEG